MATTTKQQAKKYVVLSDGLVVTTGKKQNGRAEYTRLARGSVINGSPDSERIKSLLRAGSIMLAKSKEHFEEVRADLKDPARSRHRQTVKKAAAAAGAPDDPVAAPVADVQPVDASLPETDPDAIRAVGTDPEADE